VSPSSNFKLFSDTNLLEIIANNSIDTDKMQINGSGAKVDSSMNKVAEI
jgi:hypothetical protein